MATSSNLLDRCPPSGLKVLLSLAAGQSGDSGSLPSAVRDRAELVRLLTEMCAGSTEESGEVLLSTVTSRETPLQTLQGTKEMAKALMADAATEAHRAAATFLYHAAVAAALRFGVNISTIPAESRVPLYEDLAGALGADPLGAVFRDAADRLVDVGESA